MSIKTKFLIFGLSISLIPISIITTLYYFNARSTIERQTLDWLTAVDESKKVHFLSFLEAKKGRVVDFSSDGFIRDSLEIIFSRGTQSHAVPDLNRHLKVNKMPLDSHITAIAVLDLSGYVVASTNELWIGKDMSEEDIFMSCVAKSYGGTYTGKSYTVPYLNENCIFISAPLTSRQKNKTMGVIINAYDIAILDEITTKRAGMGESGEALLGMRKGDSVVFLTTLKYAPDMPLSKSVPLDSSGAKPMRLALQGESGAIIAPDYRDINVVAAYQYIPDKDWGLVTKIDKNEVFAPITRLRIFTIILGSISTIVVITIAILVSKRVTRPIQKLVEGTKKIASGDLDFKITTKSRDEIGLLATSFNDMTSQLKESKRQIGVYAKHLEQTVEDKTKEIRKSRDEWVNTFDAITDIITIHDKDFRIIRANKAFYEKFNDGMVQLSEKKCDKKCYEIFHGTDKPWPDCPLERSNKSLQPESEEVDDPNMGGVFLISTYPILDEKGEFFGVVHQARDITIQKNVERKLAEKSKDLETANNEIEDFVYIVSHDLKEPLFVIGSYMSKLSRLYKDIFDDKGKFYIDRININTDSMNQKIHEVMEVLKAGRVVYDFKNNDTGVIANDVVKMLEAKMVETKINILIQDNLPTVLCDERRMEDVLSNLLTNAIKFMGNHKQRQVRIGCDKNGNDYYKFYVEDTGIGILEKYQEQIFKIFGRLKEIDAEGTGVGLTIVKKIVEQHKGKVWIESPVSNGRGTRFCFTIPKDKRIPDHQDIQSDG